MKDGIILFLFISLIFGLVFVGVRLLAGKGLGSSQEYQTQEQDTKLSEQRILMQDRQRDQREAMRRQQQRIKDSQRR